MSGFNFKIPSMPTAQSKSDNNDKRSTVAAKYFKAHWVDYLLLFFICFILGAFDIFILQRSDKFLDPSYWYHAGCRMAAYVLAAILGVRIGYPKAKNSNEELRMALAKNKKLLIVKEIDSVSFGDFICQINLEIKKNAWKVLINNKLKKLDKNKPAFYTLYYKDKKEEHFSRFKKLRKKWHKWRVESYCTKRQNLEALLEEEYIDKNINVLNVNYYRVRETDFTMTSAGGVGYKYYKTQSNIKRNAARSIGSGLLITMVITLVIGSVALSIDEALLEARIVTIFTIIINSILDIGITLWKFLAAFGDCERIVREEDLRSCLDRNELLVRYKRTLEPEQIAEYEKELIEYEKERTDLQRECENI